jgi:hypothetical protein
MKLEAALTIRLCKPFMGVHLPCRLRQESTAGPRRPWRAPRRRRWLSVDNHAPTSGPLPHDRVRPHTRPRLLHVFFLRLTSPRQNTQKPCNRRMPCIRHLRKTRRIAVSPIFTEARRRGDPIEPVRSDLVEMGPPPPRSFRRRGSHPQADEARMRTNPRRGRQVLSLVGLALVVSLAERAQAQQGGLFPLAPIRRQRVPCDQADPVYKLYKQQYFGYHPTCWRRFPDGWGCPNPEAPNAAQSFERIKPGEREGGEGAAPVQEGTGAPPAGGARQPLPNLPPDRSPFETDTPAPGPAATPAPAQGRPAPRVTPPPEGARSPFEMLNPEDQAAPPRRNPPADRTAPPPGDNAPELSAPARQPTRSPEPRAMQDDSEDEVVGRADESPLLDVPSIDLSRAAAPGPFFDPPTAGGSTPPTNASPARSAPRRGLLSNLFGGLGLNWTRR